MKKIGLAILVSTLLLFAWSGVTQLLPWGVPSAQNIAAQSGTQSDDNPVPNLVQVPPEHLTTDEFDTQFLDKISTYTTDDSFSWIITQRLNNDYSGYFAGEFFTHFLVSIFLSALLFLTAQLGLWTRMAIIVAAALAAVTATYGQLFNWWRLPPVYAVGVSLNLLVGWLLATFISARFILVSEKESEI